MAAGGRGVAGAVCVADGADGVAGAAGLEGEVPEMTTGAAGGEMLDTWAVPEPTGALLTAAEVDPAATGGLTLLACK